MSDSDVEDVEQLAPQKAVIDQSELHPLFWDAGYLPEDPSHPDRLAIESFIGEFTPEERAQSCKERGNDRLQFALKHNKKEVMREAIKAYTEGLQFGVENAEFVSMLHSNRAQAHIHLGNWGNALYDCKWAIKKNPNNIKAYFRGARCAFNLKDYDFCQQFCEQGQKLDPENQEFESLKQKAVLEQEKFQKIKDLQELEKKMREKPFKQLAKVIIQQRGLKVTSPQFKSKDQKVAFLDDGGGLHFPVMFIYPETMQQDIIEDVYELDLISDHLDVMFGEGAQSLPWDTKQEYSRKTIELYYLTNAGRVMNEDQLILALQGSWPEGFQDAGPQRYGSKSSTWKMVDQAKSLITILQQQDYIIPGIPVFFVVAKNTEYKDRFLSQD